MELEQKIAAFLAKVETKPARSKLAPFDGLIRSLRQKRWTLLAIAQTMETEFGLKVNPKTVWAYLKVRRDHIKTGVVKLTEKPAPAKLTPPARRFNLDA